MKIEHSGLFNSFIVFYFVTSVDGEAKFETIIDYGKKDWYTQPINTDESHALLQNKFPDLPEDAVADDIKKDVTSAIENGLI